MADIADPKNRRPGYWERQRLRQRFGAGSLVQHRVLSRQRKRVLRRVEHYYHQDDARGIAFGEFVSFGHVEPLIAFYGGMREGVRMAFNRGMKAADHEQLLATVRWNERQPSGDC